MAKPAYDPKRIFRIAEWFHLARTILMQSVSTVRGVFVPAVVLNAFSLELYLKCLIAVETGKNPPSGHNLRWLFNKLSNNTQDKIKHYFDNPSESNEIKLRETLKNPQPPIPKKLAISPYNFDVVLDLSAKAFERLRYVFERGEFDNNANWHADYIVICTRRVILEMYPDWNSPGANY